MDSQEEATLNMAANAALSRRHGSSHRKRALGRHVTVDNSGSDFSLDRHWTSTMMVDKSTQVESQRQEVEADNMRKKTILQGLLILVLLVHTTTSLRMLQATVTPPPFYNLILVITVLALVFQAAAGGLITIIALMERHEKQDMEIIRKINDFTIKLVFVVLLLCVFLSSLVPNFKKDPSTDIHAHSNSGIVIE
ncbi:uncharacterized protein LOC110458891 [Mizuhopecten yessoensis]|uniref:Ninjurin-1 n=1 Tax=Mizuhopecten yessoensis TaxID=6573 RepID=A0A210Q5Q1_MIZYE|nr:uncharacterized protein LOC110458891 [Mizuhopecten yessoensis]OWF44082.1 hypothetical protein KP79_PYT21107 [Mizuhopecten yessoensis]